METPDKGLDSPDNKLGKVRSAVNEAAFSVLAVLEFVAYLIWPTGITDTPLAQLTLGSLFLAAASVAITLAVLFGLWWWFFAKS